MKVKNMILNRIDEVVHNTALANEDFDFMATHMPFKRLRYSNELNRDKVKETLTEEKFLEEHIIRKRNNHKMVFVKGNAGSGKSHLIRWFYTMYKNRVDEQDELIILISRDSNSLKGTLRQIVNSELFKGFENDIKFKKIIEAGELLEENKLREEIPALLSSTIRTNTELRKKDREYIANFLNADVIREEILFRKNGPIERMIDGILGTENNRKKIVDNSQMKFMIEDFDILGIDILRRMRDTQGEEGASSRAIRMAEKLERRNDEKNKLVSILNNNIDAVIQRILNLGSTDLQDVFKSIREKLKKEGMNLTIFFEDITTTRGIHKELLESLIVNHNENKNLCRIISFVGITENYYNSDIQDNIKGRITDGIDIEESSLIENENDLAQFVGLYMNAINQKKDQLANWYRGGGLKKDIPTSNLNLDKSWSVINIQDDKEVSIYPFTKNYLWKVYNSLDNIGKEPRHFLELVFNNLYFNYIYDNNDFGYLLERDVYGDIQIPPLKDSYLSNYIKEACNQNLDMSGRMELFIRLWGDGSLNYDGENLISNIPVEAFEDLNFNIDKLKVTKNSNIEVSELKIKITPETQKSSIERRYEEEINSIENWINGGVLYDHKFYRETIENMFANLINWEEYNISKYQIESLLSIKYIYIEGQGKIPNYGIVFKRNSETRNLLEAIVRYRYLGEKSWGFENADKYLELVTLCLENYKNEILNIIDVPGEEKYLEVLLLNSYYINVLAGNINGKETIDELYFKLIINADRIEDKNDIRSLEEGSIFYEWIKLKNIIINSDDFNKNQEILIRYLDMPLGIAQTKSDNNNINCNKALLVINKLKSKNWSLSEYSNIKIRDREIDIPVKLFYNMVKHKLKKLYINTNKKYKEVISDLKKKHGGELDNDSYLDIKNRLINYFNLIDVLGFRYTFEEEFQIFNKNIKNIKLDIKSLDDNIDFNQGYIYMSEDMEKIIYLENYNLLLNRIQNKMKELNIKLRKDGVDDTDGGMLFLEEKVNYERELEEIMISLDRLLEVIKNV